MISLILLYFALVRQKKRTKKRTTQKSGKTLIASGFLSIRPCNIQKNVRFFKMKKRTFLMHKYTIIRVIIQ